MPKVQIEDKNLWLEVDGDRTIYYSYEDVIAILQDSVLYLSKKPLSRTTASHKGWLIENISYDNVFTLDNLVIL
jgi:hypothetical protein